MKKKIPLKQKDRSVIKLIRQISIETHWESERNWQKKLTNSWLDTIKDCLETTKCEVYIFNNKISLYINMLFQQTWQNKGIMI